jgi:hypothetical protein
MTKKAPRIPIHTMPSHQVQMQYLVIPYADFRVGSLGALDNFKFGPFLLWRDSAENWQKVLNRSRPSKHLAMYVGRDGSPLGSMWIASLEKPVRSIYHRWQWLIAALFYLAWARIPFVSVDRAAAEDFYSESFVVPEGAEADSLTHVRGSKFGTTVWSEIKIHPALEVSIHGTQIDLPLDSPPPSSLFYDPTPGELFKALEREIGKPESRLLTGLWFLHQASYRSAYRSDYAEDIQNICSAFEAILDVKRRGDSAKQVSGRIKTLFRPLACSPVEKALSRRPGRERAEVLNRLGAWINALYQVRNEYTHGKAITSFIFGERSIWQDALEVFRMTANRVILRTAERRPEWGSLLEKRLMSVAYLDEVVAFFSKKGEWINIGKKKKGQIAVYREIIRKARSLDPQLVESISSLKSLKQSLFNMCTKICRTLERANSQHRLPDDALGVLSEMQLAYKGSQSKGGGLNTDEYIRRVASRLSFWVPTIPMEGRRILLYELVAAFKGLLSVYGNFTSPIINTLSGAPTQRQ